MKHNKYRMLAILLAAIMMAQAPVSVKATGGNGVAGVAAVGSGMEQDGETSETTTASETTKEPETTKAPETEAPQTEAPETEAPQTASESEQPQSSPAEESSQAAQTEPERPAVPSGEDVTEAYVEPSTESGSKAAGELSTEKTTAESTEETTETSTAESSSVAETLGPIVHDYIIEPELVEDFRFTKIDAVPAILKPNAAIRTEKKDSADTVAIAKGTAIVYLIEKGREWCFVESEYIRGYAKRSDLILGETAEESLAKREAWKEEHAVSGGHYPYGSLEEKIPYLENPAFADVKETTMEVQAKKVFAIAKEDLVIYDNQAAAILDRKDLPDTQVLGVLAKGGLAYILDDDGGKTVFVESSDVRGFVNRELLETGKSAKKKVKSKGETKFTQAQQKVDVEENPVLYYTVLSVEKPGDAVRAALVKFALQFVGNPYLWGGTSLTHGTDCSGFTQSVYRHFGYEIPRTSGPQANFGTNMGIKPEYAKPGDIVCYAGHVALYIGDGKIVHASNSKRYPAGGIKVSDVDIMTIIAIRRIIP